MAHSDVVNTIETHVRSAFSSCRIFGEDEWQNAPDDGAAFLVVTFPYARSEQFTMGSPGENHWQEEGAFVLTLALPRGGGLRQGQLWLDELASTFRGRDIGPVECAAPQSAVLDDEGGVGAHVRLVMSVPYRFWVQG